MIITAAFLVSLVAQEPVDPLTRDAVEKAATTPDLLKSAELTLWHHSGTKETGNILRIRGDGTVSRSWSSYYPLTAGEEIQTRTLRLPLPPETVASLARRFADGAVLALPRLEPRLVEPKDGWPKTMRYALGFRIPGKKAFEGEHPDVEWSKLDQIPSARTLIQEILKSVAELEKKIEDLDRAFLTGAKTSELLRQEKADLVLELQDTGTLWGGRSVRLDRRGNLLALKVRPPKAGESGMQTERSGGPVATERAAALFSTCVDLNTMDVQQKRKTGIADEAMPMIVLRATVDGIPYSRSVWLFDGEAGETKAFRDVQNLLIDLSKVLLP